MDLMQDKANSPEWGLFLHREKEGHWLCTEKSSNMHQS